MLTEAVAEALNVQINSELAGYYSYLGMSAYFETTPYSGFASWHRSQAEEEREHAMKLYQYVNDRGGVVELRDLAAPNSNFSGPIQVFEASLEQEKSVTLQIHNLYELAREEKDHATVHFLSWFLGEQVEEEKTAQDMVDRLKLVGDHPSGLLRLDAEAGRRQE